MCLCECEHSTSLHKFSFYEDSNSYPQHERNYFSLVSLFMPFQDPKPTFLIKEQVVIRPEPEPVPASEPKPTAASPPAPEEADLTWEDKEDKLDAENIQPDSDSSNASDKKYQYKEGECLNVHIFP